MSGRTDAPSRDRDGLLATLQEEPYGPKRLLIFYSIGCTITTLLFAVLFFVYYIGYANNNAQFYAPPPPPKAELARECMGYLLNPETKDGCTFACEDPTFEVAPISIDAKGTEVASVVTRGCDEALRRCVDYLSEFCPLESSFCYLHFPGVGGSYTVGFFGMCELRSQIYKPLATVVGVQRLSTRTVYYP